MSQIGFTQAIAIFQKLLISPMFTSCAFSLTSLLYFVFFINHSLTHVYMFVLVD